jgi:GntR family transcriptional regulator, vanillate catabolism transcriptional regulator
MTVQNRQLVNPGVKQRLRAKYYSVRIDGANKRRSGSGNACSPEKPPHQKHHYCMQSIASSRQYAKITFAGSFEMRKGKLMRSQQSRILVQLRDLILNGEFAPGQRLAEIPIAERLGASRTPVRLAFTTLEQEGLVELSPSGGYSIRALTRKEIDDAIAVRGTLEGMAARLLAENGITRQMAAEFRECLTRGDMSLSASELTIDAYTDYVEMNDRFHELLIEFAGNGALARAIELNGRLPFAAPSATLPMHVSTGDAKRWLCITQHQHHVILEAIERHEGTRAQAVAIEHVEVARMNLRAAFEKSQEISTFMPAMRLLKR